MIKCLISLLNLVRINGIAALVLTTFSEADYKAIKEIINFNKEEMLERVTQIN